MAPDIMSWPRRSNIRPLRHPVISARKLGASFEHAVVPSSCGPPPVDDTHRLPQVWPSMQKNDCAPCLSPGGVFRNGSGDRPQCQWMELCL